MQLKTEISFKLQSWPWQVAVVESGETICGGVILSPTSLVTAAHCITSNNDFILNDYHSQIKPGIVALHKQISDL